LARAIYIRQRLEFKAQSPTSRHDFFPSRQISKHEINLPAFITVLREHSTRRIPNDFLRRWLGDDYFDLIVWYENDGSIHGFQLCYDKPGQERSLIWTLKRGFVHTGIDEGEQTPFANCTPILVPDGVFPAALVREQFNRRSSQIDELIREFVLAKIQEFESRSKEQSASS
jgi:hypothetical protein